MSNKKFNPQQFAPAGLILALLALGSSIILGLVKGIAALKLYTPANPQTLTLALQISVGLTIVGLALYAMLAPEKVRRFLSGRQARYGSNTLINAVAFIGILFVINMLVYQNPKSWDVTEDKSHTLAPETLQALNMLPAKVTATAFYSARLSTTSVSQLLQDFKINSNGKFDYRFVDPDLDPVAARQAGITGDGKILLTMGERHEIASYATEEELTRSLIRLISPETRVVYFITGHGEADISQSSNANLSSARSTLENKNYTVKTLNLAAENKIPEDARVIIVAGPTKPLSEQEVSLLKAYVEKGGSLIVLEDPLPLTNFGEAPDPLADYLASTWGITLDNDIIITPSQQPLYAVAAGYDPNHPITRAMTMVVILPQARSISLGVPPANVTLTGLIQTAQQAWGETNFTDTNNVKYDAGEDKAGPLTMAVAGENTSTKGRVVVFGNSLFITDNAFNAYGNSDIFINAVDWAAEQENLIQITPRQPVQRSFKLPSQLQWIAILIGSIFVLPGLVILAGIASWISRRQRG